MELVEPAAQSEADPAEMSELGEVDEVKALEAATFEPVARTDSSLRKHLSLLGVGDALRERMALAIDDIGSSGDSISYVLEPVTDISAFDVSKVKDRYDIPVEMRPLVAQYIHFFQHQGRKWFRRWMGRSTRFIPMMQPILEEAGLPKDTVYLAMIESGFSTSARSWAAAVGPWQFIAGTADLFRLKRDFWKDERNDFIKSTRAASQYLSQLYQNHGDWYLAWAGYNTGGGRVRALTTRYGTSDFWTLSEKTKPGFAKETQHYVPKLIACALIAKHPDAFGFTPDEFEFEKPLQYDEVSLDAQIDLEVLAKIVGTSVEELKVLNPELKRWCTPPASASEPYSVRVPKGLGVSAKEQIAQLAPAERLHFKVHRIVRGDNLSKIASHYASASEAIMRVNGLRSPRGLRLGADLMIPIPSASALKSGKADPAFERQVARARRSGIAVRPEEDVPVGTRPAVSSAAQGSVQVAQVGGKTRVTYGIAQGDSLWSIARRFDVRVNDLRSWNSAIPNAKRGLRAGMQLVVWPGPKANL